MKAWKSRGNKRLWIGSVQKGKNCFNSGRCPRLTLEAENVPSPADGGSRAFLPASCLRPAWFRAWAENVAHQNIQVKEAMQTKAGTHCLLPYAEFLKFWNNLKSKEPHCQGGFRGEHQQSVISLTPPVPLATLHWSKQQQQQLVSMGED